MRGEMRVSGGDKFFAQLRAHPEGEPTFECIIKDEKSSKPGFYHIFYNVDRPGSYILTIECEESQVGIRFPIAGSPFMIELDF
jgi:hypothetical protein